MPTTGPLSQQNIKDRYFGVNDPVANKMMDRVNAMEKLEAPADTSITTLYVGGITPDMLESDIQVELHRVILCDRITLQCTPRPPSQVRVDAQLIGRGKSRETMLF